jgi:hypothetical protein
VVCCGGVENSLQGEKGSVIDSQNIVEYNKIVCF